MAPREPLLHDPLRGRVRATPNSDAFQALPEEEKRRRLEGFREFIEKNCPTVDEYLVWKRAEARREAEGDD